MEDIRLYNFDFNLLCIENNVISSNWHLKNNGIGSFEMHFSIESEMTACVKENLDIINNKLVVISQGKKQGIVTGIRLRKNCEIYGKTCNFLLSKRLTPKFSTSSLEIKKDVESIARYCVSNAFSDVDNFRLGDVLGFDEMYINGKHFWRNVYNPTNEVVQALMDNGGGGYSVLFDIKNKCWVYNTTKYRENNLLISVGMKNAYDMENTQMIGDYCSCGWYEKQQELVDGVRPDPVWTYITREEKSGIYRWEGRLDGLYESEAIADLKTKKVSDETEVSLRNLYFEKDYNLGDIVKLQYKFGAHEKTVKKLIYEIILSYENNKISEKPIFKEVSYGI